jgi:mannose-6-phosphate isomerase-like protein (cupin superfamily)
MRSPDWLFSLADVAKELAEASSPTRFHQALRHGTMKLGLYAPAQVDRQEPHGQDELYVVAAGSGDFIKNGERRPFKANDVIFVEAGVEHRFVDFTDDFACWVIFWGPEGGEEQRAVAARDR